MRQPCGPYVSVHVWIDTTNDIHLIYHAVNDSAVVLTQSKMAFDQTLRGGDLVAPRISEQATSVYTALTMFRSARGSCRLQASAFTSYAVFKHRYNADRAPYRSHRQLIAE